MGLLLSLDTRLSGDEIIHGHLLPEGTCEVNGGPCNGSLTFIEEEDDRAMRETEGGKRSRGICQIREGRSKGGRFCEEEALLTGKDLGRDWNSELRRDGGLEMSKGGRRVDRNALEAVPASDTQKHGYGDVRSSLLPGYGDQADRKSVV